MEAPIFGQFIEKCLQFAIAHSGFQHQPFSRLDLIADVFLDEGVMSRIRLPGGVAKKWVARHRELLKQIDGV